MTIIESIKQFIEQCPYLSEYKRGIDFLGKDTESYSIDTVPCTPVIKRYIGGSAIKQYQFTFSTREEYGREVVQNLLNLEFYEHFAEWLDAQTKQRNLPQLDGSREARKIEALTVGYPFETDTDQAKYQIQCRLTYYEGEQ